MRGKGNVACIHFDEFLQMMEGRLRLVSVDDREERRTRRRDRRRRSKGYSSTSTESWEKREEWCAEHVPNWVRRPRKRRAPPEESSTSNMKKKETTKEENFWNLQKKKETSMIKKKETCAPPQKPHPKKETPKPPKGGTLDAWLLPRATQKSTDDLYVECMLKPPSFFSRFFHLKQEAAGLRGKVSRMVTCDSTDCLHWQEFFRKEDERIVA